MQNRQLDVSMSNLRDCSSVRVLVAAVCMGWAAIGIARANAEANNNMPPTPAFATGDQFPNVEPHQQSDCNARYQEIQEHRTVGLLPLKPTTSKRPQFSEAIHGITGSAFENATDFQLPSVGPSWSHTRTFDSLLDSTDSSNNSAQGWLWRHSMMPVLTSTDSGNYTTSDADVAFSAYRSLSFDNTGTDTWSEEDFENFTLTHDATSNALIVSADDGHEWWFRDFDYGFTHQRGKLFEIRDPYDNKLELSYTSGILTQVDDAGGHRMLYKYISGGDNNGKLESIEVFLDTDTNGANLIGKVEYEYFNNDTNTNGGSAGDLQRVTVSRRGTSDSGGTLSIVTNEHYRYWDGNFNAMSNPGTDHKLKYILRPENYVRFADSNGVNAYKTASDEDVAGFANVYLEYDSNYRVARIEERSGACSSCGGSAVGTTDLDWTENGSTPTDYNGWALHCMVDREDDTRIIFDVNKHEQILNWVFQDTDDGSPNYEWIWHNEYDDHNRLAKSFAPSANEAYDESQPYLVTTRASEGFVTSNGYFGSGDYEDYLKRTVVMQGSNGSKIAQTEFGRTISERPDVATSMTRYESESGGGSSGQTTTYAYTFYDGEKRGIKEIDTTYPSVSTAKNGPNASAVEKRFLDTYGFTRWMLDGESFVHYSGFDDVNSGDMHASGLKDLNVKDVDTSTLPSIISSDWDGTDYGFGSSTTVPFARGGGLPSALNIDDSSELDFLGRLRHTTDAGGTETWYVYKDNEVRIYPAFDSATSNSFRPAVITIADEEGRTEESIQLSTATNINTSSDKPDGTEAVAQSDYVSWSKQIFNRAGQKTSSIRYHDVPSSGDGTRYSNFYQTDFEYDDMGRLEWTIEDVADESPYDREQLIKYSYDAMGRRFRTGFGVSDNNHDITASKPTTRAQTRIYFDDPDDALTDTDQEDGVGDGNISWMSTFYAQGQANSTRYDHDWRNRQTTTIPPLAPYTLQLFDNLDRATAAGTFSATTSLDPGDDPSGSALASSRLSLSKTHFDEVGRVYKVEKFMDPSDSTPADALVSNTYYDRRGQVWAVDAPNTGVRFTQFDGARRRIASFSGTQFDPAGKFDSGAPDYPDDDEGIVEHTAFTLDDEGKVTQTVRKELNHDDTNGMDLDGSDFIRTYSYTWYDDAERVRDMADFGTNTNGWKDADSPTYGASPPASSDTVLVTSYSYDTAGRQDTVTDPRGIETETEFDDLGRSIAKIEDAGMGNLNRKTEYQYNAAGSLVRIIHDPGADNDYASGVWTEDGSDVDQITEYAYTNWLNSEVVTEIRYPTGDGTVGSASTDKIVFDYSQNGQITSRTDQNGNVVAYTYDTLRRKSDETLSTVGSGVDSSVRLISWDFDDAGRVEYVTTRSGTTSYAPTVSTDAVNQIKNTYDDGGNLIKQEQEHDGIVDGSTLAAEFNYDTDFSTDNYKRLEYVEYPDGKRIYRGYTHTGSGSTFQDDINDAFSRVGQLALEDSTPGSIGDVFAEYDFNGAGRLVRRNHASGSGLAGNDTRTDLWHGTTGTYAGLDQFGRIADMKFTDFSGASAVEFDRRIYTYDRNGNPTIIENDVFAGRSQALEYDDLDRLVQQDEGILSSGSIELSDLMRQYNMDLLGNLSTTTSGFKQNSDTATFVHTVNATNEITEIDRENPAGQARLVSDDFSSTMSSIWSTQNGSWTVSGGKLSSTGLGVFNSPAQLNGSAITGDSSISVTVTLPTQSVLGTKAGGPVFARSSSSSKYAVVLTAGSPGTVALASGSGGFWTNLKSGSVTINTGTAYQVEVEKKQRHIAYRVWNGSTLVYASTYDSNVDFQDGLFGFYAGSTYVSFDDFSVTRLDQVNAAAPRWASTAKTTLDSTNENFKVESSEWGGEARLEWVGDDAYIAQADIDLNGGEDAELKFRYADPDNYYAARIGEDTGGGSGPIELIQVVRGKESVVDSSTYAAASSVTLKVRVDANDDVEVWVDGSSKIIDTNGLDIGAGTVALSGVKAVFDNVKIGYDTGSDDVIDEYVVDETFGGTDITPTYDDNGNLTFDGNFKYTYDAWNRLVKATLDDTDVTIHEAAFDGLGRRVVKTVSNSGDLDGVTEYYHNRNQIIETRDGSGNLETQVYHGTQYSDEVVGMRVAGLGRIYVHQDANYDVTGTTDLTARQIERNYYSPYGQLEVAVDTHPFDYDDDGDVDDGDYAVTTNGTCTGTATGECRRMDADADGDVDSTDQTTIIAYIANLTVDTEMARMPAATSGQRGNSFGHQGLTYDAEIRSYQNRFRHYSNEHARFLQPDPLRSSAGAYYGYPDGMNPFESNRSSPLHYTDPMGLQAGCAPVICQCGGAVGTIELDLIPNSGLAQIISNLAYGGAPTAVTLPGGAIRCSGSCDDCDGVGSDGMTPVFDHECCHACAAERGFFDWLFTWIPGDIFGYCNRNSVPSRR